MIQYSFVSPIYNDAYLADEFCSEIERVLQKYLGRVKISDDIEIIFVSDGSSEDSMRMLLNLSQKKNFVKVIELSRNFGQHIAISCGYQHASGQYVGMLNVDMQDPPDQIPLLIDYMKQNDCDIVYGLRETRYSQWSDKISSFLFNLILNKLTGSDTPLNVSTLRLMNRKFLDTYNSLSEKSRYLPGLESWLGFRPGYVRIQHQKRKRGKSTYTFKKRWLMALDSIISFSDLPLKVISIIGILISLIGFLLILILIISKLFFINYQPGFTSTISIVVFIGGMQVLVIGLAGLYIGRILKEVQNRPLYVIKNKYNF
jgi:dolichol-phosphate mannosyltransferase